MKQPETAGAAYSSTKVFSFSDLRDHEKLLGAMQLVYASPIDSYIAAWLFNRLSRENIIEDNFSRQQFETILQQLDSQGFMQSMAGGYVLNPQYISQAFAWPLTKNLQRKIAQAVNQLVTTSEYSSQSRYTTQSERSLIISYYLGVQDFEDTPDFSYLEEGNDEIFNLTARLAFNFHDSWFQLLPESSQISIFSEIHCFSLLTCEEAFSDLECGLFKYFMQPHWLKSALFLEHGAHVIAERLLMQGDFQRARTYIECSTSPEAAGLQAMTLFLFHGQEAALPAFRNALRELRKSRKKKLSGFRTLADVFYSIALIQNGTPECLHEAKQHFEKVSRPSLLYPPFYLHLKKLFEARITGHVDHEQILQQINHSAAKLNNFFGLLTLRWLGITNPVLYEEPLSRLISQASAAGYLMPACEGLRLKRALGMTLTPDELQRLTDWDAQLMLPLAEIVEQRAPWEIVLEALNTALNLAGCQTDAADRLIWEIKLNLPRSFEIYGREQTRLKSGKWSAGKIVDNHRYFNGMKPFPDFYTMHDQLIFKALQNVRP